MQEHLKIARGFCLVSVNPASVSMGQARAVSVSSYDHVAPAFDQHRALPAKAAAAVRKTVLSAIDAASSPRLLDLGAGTGRIGRAFVDAGDDYCGVDLSFGMLREFTSHAARERNSTPRLVQADGERLPFAEATFDAVMLIQVIGAARDWRRLLAEARRVLRPDGALIVAHTVMPEDGLDEQMKRRLAALLAEVGASSYHINLRRDVQRRLDLAAGRETRVVAAEWDAARTPRAFIERQRSGARFSVLPEMAKDAALRRLSAWAVEEFGSLDAVFPERHAFELSIFRFNTSAGG